MVSTLYLFPDTNLFIQCRPLEELDWTQWSAFDQVHLIVSRPVQREIDNQKTRGGDRVGKRARTTNALFKKIIVGSDGYKLIRDAGPQVRLVVDPTWRASPELADQLDYDEPDDEIVGCLHAFRKAHSGDDARLLTHDSGPMATAKMLGLPFEAISGDWLVPPESSDAERKANRLQAELERLKKTEPQIRLTCLDNDDNETDALALAYTMYEPLTDDDVAQFMGSLRKHFPLATEFGSREPDKREVSSGLGGVNIKETYIPASDEEIAAYKDEKYPGWLTSCEYELRHLHVALQGRELQPGFCFAAVNAGSRPANDALITFTARGRIQVCAPPWRDDDDDGDEDNDGDDGKSVSAAPALPPLPPPPRGKWTRSAGGYSLHSRAAADLLRNIQRQLDPFAGMGRDHHLSILRSTIPVGRPPDPNAFYYKPERPKIPGASFSLECAQWRHSPDKRLFSGEIFFDLTPGEVSGELECLIHAENLSDPVRKIVPVTVSVSKVSSRETAAALMEALVKRTGS